LDAVLIQYPLQVGRAYGTSFKEVGRPSGGKTLKSGQGRKLLLDFSWPRFYEKNSIR